MYFYNYITLLLVMLSHLMTCTNSEYRMRGSIDSNIGEHPYLVSIIYDNKNYCVGSLISLTKAVSAAIRVRYYPEHLYTVVAGTPNLCHMDEHAQIREVKKIHYPHPAIRGRNDLRIAVVEVHETFDRRPTVRPIEYHGCTVEENALMHVSGWGGATAENGETSNIVQCAVLTLTRNDVYHLLQCELFGRIMANEVLDTRVADFEFIGAPGVVNGKLCAVMQDNRGETIAFIYTNSQDNIIFLDRMRNS